MIELLGNLIISWWCWWSNYRFKHCIRSNIGTQSIDKAGTLQELKNLVRRLYDSFIWTADSIDQLGDAVVPPPQNYATYLEQPLKDDCDGFHSLVYHCLYNSGIECYLLTVTPSQIKNGHCVLIFKLDGKWYVNDYFEVYQGFDNIQDAIDDYNKDYLIKYKISGKIIYNGLVEYNYVSEKFKRRNISDFKK